MEFEIRLRENKWDVTGGWNWRLWQQAFGGVEKLINWGWAPTQSEALNDANYYLDVLEEDNDRSL